MKSRRFSFSISTALLWTTVIGFSLATFRFSNSWTETLFAFGCCAVSLGLLQQIAWLRKLTMPDIYCGTVRLAMSWRICVVLAMAWSFVMLAASHHGYAPESVHVGYGDDTNPWFGTQHLAIAGLSVGCLCGIMTAPWLRLNRLALNPATVRGFLFAIAAGIPLVLHAAYQCGAIVGLIDIATQGILIGTLEPVSVSSGALPTNISRGNALNSLFVERSIRAWVGVTLALVVVSVAGRISTRPRVSVYSCVLALALSIPAVLLIHWLSIDGFRRVSPHFWLVHHWPSWHATTLAILPWIAVSVILSIRRQGIEIQTQDGYPLFLCDAYLTYLAFAATPAVWIWETIRALLDSEFGGLMVALMDGMTNFLLTVAVGEMVSPTGGMLLTTLAVLSLGATVSRWRYASISPRRLTTIRPGQVLLLVVVSSLVALVVICTIPFGVALLHLGI